MKNQVANIHSLVREALTAGRALTIRQIRAERDRSRKAIRQGKVIFWVAIALLNLMVWVKIPIPLLLRVGIGLLALMAALIAPIIWSKQHHLNLLLLEQAAEGPKRRKASPAAKKYIDQVREQDRPFIRAEVEILEADKYAEQDTDT